MRINGRYTVVSAAGVPLRRGAWHAHQLTRFTGWSGSHELGGVLEVMATLTSDTGGLDQQRMRFVCTSNKPPTVGEDEGVTVGAFLEHHEGMVHFRKH